MGRVRAEEVSDSTELEEGQQIAAEVLSVDNDHIEHESIFGTGVGYLDLGPYEWSLEDVSVGDVVVFEYVGGTTLRLDYVSSE